MLNVRGFVSLGELTPDDVDVQVLHGKIDSNDVLTDVTVKDLALADTYDGGRYRFDGDIQLDRGGPFGYTVRVIPRNDLPSPRPTTAAGSASTATSSSTAAARSATRSG